MHSLSYSHPSLNIDLLDSFTFYGSLLTSPLIPRLSSFSYASLFQDLFERSYDRARRSLVHAIEHADRLFRDLPDRKRRFYVKQTRPRTIITFLGEITFLRTEYLCRDTNQPYCYIDDKLCLRPRQRYDCCIEARVKELYADHNSMIKVGKIIGELIFSPFSIRPLRKLHHIPRQTIYNLLRRGPICHVRRSPADETPDTLYISADEKFIPVQGEGPFQKEMVKMAVCFEGKEQEARKDGTKTRRNKLLNKYIFALCSSDDGSFWPTLYDQLADRYDLSRIKKIYIMGDGATWIRSGVKELTMPGTRVRFALDLFHASQAICRMSREEAFREALTRYLYALKKEEFLCVADIARSYLKSAADIKRFDENLDYLMKQWDGLKVMIEDVKIGCAMEQAISHVLASPFTSVPKAYGRKNLPVYLSTRIQQQNGEDIMVNHLNAIDKSRDTGEAVIELYDGCDFSFFDDMIREEAATVHLKNWNRYTDTRF